MKNSIKNVIKQITPSFILLFVWVGWSPYLLSLFDKYFLPYLDIDISIYTSILFILISIIVIIRLVNRCLGRYFVSIRHLSYLILCLVVYLSVRFADTYIYLPNWSVGIGYTDILALVILCAIITCLIGYFSNAGSNEDENLASCHRVDIIPDIPITSAENDILDYAIDARNLAEKINHIPFKNSLSIGITSIWGAGKSTYLNLLEEALDKSKYIIIKFNPRYSKNASFIQEDFFNVLANVLKEYSSDFSQLIKKYLDALNIFNDKTFVKFLLGVHSLYDKDDRKQVLEDAIKRLPKRIIIFIEDFDRLMPDEIIEIFKLIDGNASFTNLLFISAYDKEHINKIIERDYLNEESCFSDKFFALEVPVPIRPYDKIFTYLVKVLIEHLVIPDERVPIYSSILREQLGFISKYLPTLRDVKRFLNLFLRDYEVIKDEVNFRDYFLLTLIKYKYPEEYRLLSKREYLNDYDYKTNQKSTLKDESKDAKSHDILEILFNPIQKYNEDTSYTSIRSDTAFGIYFYNYVHEGLPVRDMRLLLKEIDFNKIKSQLDFWINSGGIDEFIGFLAYKNIAAFESKEQFEAFIKIVFYLTSLNNGNLYLYLYTLISKSSLTEIKEKYKYEDDSYKDMIWSLFAENPSIHNAYIIRKLVVDSYAYSEKFIFTTEKLVELSELYLCNYIQNPNSTEDILEFLYGCIEYIHGETHKITLKKEACEKVRDYLLNPSRYIKEFVRLQGTSSSPDFNGITGEPFWMQIFGSADKFEQFINDKKLNDIQNISRVRNFWELYKSNGYEAISYVNQGSVAEKIEANLVMEKEFLNELRKKSREFDFICNEYEIDERNAKLKSYKYYMTKLETLRKEIELIKLPIKEKDELNLKINSLIGKLQSHIE